MRPCEAFARACATAAAGGDSTAGADHGPGGARIAAEGDPASGVSADAPLAQTPRRGAFVTAALADGSGIRQGVFTGRCSDGDAIVRGLGGTYRCRNKGMIVIPDENFARCPDIVAHVAEMRRLYGGGAP